MTATDTVKRASAKFSRPDLTGIVERARLFAHLDEARAGKIIWISAPAGAGKTILAASWLLNRNIPCLWYQADENDGDIGSFFANLANANRINSPEHPSGLPLFTPEYRLGIPTFARRYFELLFGRFKPPFCLVIDNYQEVPAHSMLHEVVRDGLSVIPKRGFSLIVSRNDPPPALSHLRLSGDLTVVDWDLVRFSREEGFSLMRARCARDADILPEEDLNAIYRKADGWAAGMVLMTEDIMATGNLPMLAEIRDDSVFEYFASQLFNREKPEIRDFLLTIAVMPKITAKTAASLSQNRRAEQILTRLARHNFFLTRHALGLTGYQFHPLFRDFLQRRALAERNHEDMVVLKKRAAALLVKEHQIEDAARLMIEAGDWEKLIDLILAQANNYIASGRGQTLAVWIDSMPLSLKDMPLARVLEGQVPVEHQSGCGKRSFRARFFPVFCRCRSGWFLPGLGRHRRYLYL